MNKRNYDVAKKEVVFIALPLLLLSGRDREHFVKN